MLSLITSYQHEIEIAFRLLLSCVLAGIIGWDRNKSGSPAGMRTMMLIALGSTMATLVSIDGFSEYGGVIDPGRIAAQIMPAIGFLGLAGVVKEGTMIKGLTTAASIWVIAAIGLAVGVGMYFIATVATVFAFLILQHKIDDIIEKITPKND